MPKKRTYKPIPKTAKSGKRRCSLKTTSGTKTAAKKSANASRNAGKRAMVRKGHSSTGKRVYAVYECGTKKKTRKRKRR